MSATERTNAGALEAELAFAIAAARWAGERALRLRGSGRWSGEMLADIGDQSADGLLQGLIRGRFPEDGVLSEETADSHERLARRRAWIVDPLDGTREYSDGRADWAVHVALTLDSRCALAAVGLPCEERVLWGVCVPGAERAGIAYPGASPANASRLLRAAEPGEPAAGPRVAVSRSHTPPWTGDFARRIGASALLPFGSAGFKVSRLLLGEADVYVHRKGLKEWDTCAPETVARALGWRVCTLRGAEHRYNQPDPVNSELVVCRPALEQRVLSALAEGGVLDG